MKRARAWVTSQLQCAHAILTLLATPHCLGTSHRPAVSQCDAQRAYRAWYLPSLWSSNLLPRINLFLQRLLSAGLTSDDWRGGAGVCGAIVCWSVNVLLSLAASGAAKRDDIRGMTMSPSTRAQSRHLCPIPSSLPRGDYDGPHVDDSFPLPVQLLAAPLRLARAVVRGYSLAIEGEHTMHWLRHRSGTCPLTPTLYAHICTQPVISRSAP